MSDSGNPPGTSHKLAILAYIQAALIVATLILPAVAIAEDTLPSDEAPPAATDPVDPAPTPTEAPPAEVAPPVDTAPTDPPTVDPTPTEAPPAEVAPPVDAPPVDPPPVDPTPTEAPPADVTPPVDAPPVDSTPVDSTVTDPTVTDPTVPDPTVTDPTVTDPTFAEPVAEPAPAVSMCVATGNEALMTEREDYAPEETVAVIGTGFAASCDIVVKVTRPDGSVVVGDGSFAPGSDTVASGTDGSFTYDYILDGIEGLYLAEAIGDGGNVLAHSVFTDAIPGTNPATYADSGRTILRNAFERGDTIYWRFPTSGAITTPDIVAKYRFRILYGSTVVSTSACLTPNGSGILDYDEVIAQSYALSDSVRTTLRLIIFSSDTNCANLNFTGSVSRDVGSGGFIFQTYAFTSAAARNACTSDGTCGSPTPRPVIRPGDTIYLKIRGFTANRAFSQYRFIRPDSSVACTFGGSTSIADANGAITFDYPSNGCPAIGSAASDIGAWTIDVTGTGTNPPLVFGTLQTTNVDAFGVKAPLTVTTAVHDGLHADVSNTELPLGSTVHDTASLAGTVTGLTPAEPTFTFFENATCSGTGTPVSANGADIGATKSEDVGPLPAGAYSFKASVAENDSYFGDASDCEPFTVSTGTATVVTEQHREVAGNDHLVLGTVAGVPYGATTHDKAIVTGVTGVAPTGTVEYKFFASTGITGCTGTALTTETVAVGVESASKTNLAPGRYSYLATYSGDANYPGALAATCEILEVGRATPGVATEVHADGDHATDVQGTSVPLGTSAHDKTIITPVDGLAVTGTITYTFFDGTTNEFAALCDGPRTSETVAVGLESSVKGPLAAGFYGFRATYNGNENYKPTTGPCEIFEVAKATPTIVTQVYREAGATDVAVPSPSEIALGSTVYDTATMGGQVDGFVIDGTVTYTLYRTAFGDPANNCDGPVYKTAETVATTDPSALVGPLPSGRYTYKAVYNGNSNYKTATAACEIFEVAKGETSVTTELHEGSRTNGATHIVIPIDGYTFAPTVHDLATVSGELAAIPMVETDKVRYNFYTNNACTGTPAQTGLSDLDVESFDKTGLLPGQYAFQAEYLGDANYKPSASDCEPFTVVPNNVVTTSSLCTFDLDSALPGDQFRLIYTPDLANQPFKLNASNSGQFYYNVFYTGPGGEPITIDIPAPFVTQGANPVHVYAGVTPITNGVTCYTPGSELAGATITGAPIDALTGGQIKVTLPTLSSGFAYIAIHLDYGQKKVLTGCSKGASDEAICTVPGAVTIDKDQAYLFEFQNTSSGSYTIHSINEFKKNPGIGGFVQKAGTEDPVEAANIEIWLGTKKMGAVKSDADGYFMWSYKYTGKPVTFTVKAPAYGLVQSATLKSNGFLAFTFTTP